MEDFNPVTMFAIMQESLGSWLWAFVVIALVLIVGVASGFFKLRSVRGPFKRPFLAALIAGIITTAIFFMLVPGWTLASFGALGSTVDYIIATLLALIPGGAVAALVFSIASRRCTGRTTLA